MDASTHFRSFTSSFLWNAYFAGSIITVEGCGYIDPTSKEPYPISEEIDSLCKFLKEVASPKDRGAHDSLVAVVLPTDNGWNERPSWGRRSRNNIMEL